MGVLVETCTYLRISEAAVLGDVSVVGGEELVLPVQKWSVYACFVVSKIGF
jgi:hypothetical protein